MFNCDTPTKTPEWSKNLKITDNLQIKRIFAYDVDNDGDIDLIGINDNTKKFVVYQNNGIPGTPLFEYNYTFLGNIETDDFVMDFAIGNLNPSQDKKFDLIMKGHFFINNGDFTWSIKPEWERGIEIGGLLNGIVIGDLDNDSKVDLLDIYNGFSYKNIGDDKLPIWGSAGDKFGVFQGYSDGVLTDIDNDGDLDLFIIEKIIESLYKYHFEVVCYINNGTTTLPKFEKEINITKNFSRFIETDEQNLGVTSGDINQDGWQDIIVQDGKTLIFYDNPKQ